MRRVLFVVLGWSIACGLSTAPRSELRPASKLEHNCYDPPYKASNHASVKVNGKRDQPATDFTLKDLDGKSTTLSDLLDDKPVLLVGGSYTCPRFQETQSATQSLANRFSDDIHTVAVYTVEAHPKSDPTPYHGKPKPKRFSDRNQQETYSARAKSAKDWNLGKNVTVLVDELDRDFANPFWCTYGTCPSCSWLIRQDGTFEAVHEWHDPKTMRDSIDALLKSR